jgi:ribose-phosphate pyrophosphokinase
MKNKKTIIYNMAGFEEMAESIAKEFDGARGKYEFKRFTNGEAQIVLGDNIKGMDCLVLGTNAPPDQRMVELLFLCHTLKNKGAKRILLILPYFAYTRQDKEEKKKGLAMDWLAKAFKISGVDEIVTVDIHSPIARKFFKMPLDSLSPAKIFAAEIEKILFTDATIIAPDEGAIDRCENVRKILHKKQPISYFIKKRDGDTISSALYGKVGEKAVIIDDILDTGGTLIVACKHLKDKGVKDIVIFVAHGLFTGEKWQELWDLGVIKIFATDTLPEARERASDGVSILSVTPLIKYYFE